MAQVVFWGSLGLLIYTFAGYPVLLWCLARWRPQPVRRDAVTPTVVMVVVAYNEAARIADKVATCLAQDYPAGRLRVLIVSDGSSDDTARVVRSIGSPLVSVLKCTERRGKAACLNDAVAACSEEIVVFTDARQRLHPQAVRRLTANFADSGVGAVSGELVFVDDDAKPFERGIGLYWSYEKFIRSNEALSGSTIGVTGALYAIRRECYQAIPSVTVLDDVAIPMNAMQRGWRVSFENGAQAYDRPSSSAQQERVRKVRTLAGNFQLLALYPALLLPWRNRGWLRFVSHKVLRLAVPLLLLALLGANLALLPAGPFFAAALVAQVGGYLCVAAALLWPQLQRWRLFGLAVTFAHLSWFVVLGFWSWLTNRQMQLWSKPVAQTADKVASRASGDAR